jgi:hypothetical protein
MKEICENCIYGSLSWLAVDGRDIRESQYPAAIDCELDRITKDPTDTCDKFKEKEY